MKKFSSLAHFSAHNQRMPTINVIFERYERIFEEKAIFFFIITVCMYLLALIFLYKKMEICKQFSAVKL